MRQVINGDTGPRMHIDPGPVGDVGNRVLAGKKLVARQMAIQNAEQATDFALIAIDGRLDLFREVAEEDIGLTHHGTHTTHLKHQPLQDLRTPLGVGGHQLAGFFGQIDEDGTRLENHKITGFMIDNRRNPPIGVDGEEARFLHLGMTSSDVLDTCLAVQLQRASDILLKGVDRVLAALEKRAFEHKLTPTIGRSHGIHAEPTTFGKKLAEAYAEFARCKARLIAARAAESSCARPSSPRRSTAPSFPACRVDR